MNNYEFCAQWVLDRLDGNKGSKVLDYGCGGGEIVKLLKQQQVDAFGCDVFCDGCEYPELMASELFGTIVLKMEDNKIPFPDNYFDLIVTNQVMEHVENLDNVMNEIDRVLNPNGRVLSLFPDLSIWREVHCGIPFLHWFPKGSQLRVYYALFLRLLGFGSYKGDKTPLKWSQDICIWLDLWTHYRSPQEIDSCYANHFTNIQSGESDWFKQRLKNRLQFIHLFPTIFNNFLAKKLAGRVIIADSKKMTDYRKISSHLSRQD